VDRDQRSEVGDLRSEIGGQKRGLAPQYDLPDLRGKQRCQGAKIRIVSHRAHRGHREGRDEKIGDEWDGFAGFCKTRPGRF